MSWERPSLFASRAGGVLTFPSPVSLFRTRRVNRVPIRATATAEDRRWAVARLAGSEEGRSGRLIRAREEEEGTGTTKGHGTRWLAAGAWGVERAITLFSFEYERGEPFAEFALSRR